MQELRNTTEMPDGTVHFDDFKDFIETHNLVISEPLQPTDEAAEAGPSCSAGKGKALGTREALGGYEVAGAGLSSYAPLVSRVTNDTWTPAVGALRRPPRDLLPRRMSVWRCDPVVTQHSKSNCSILLSRRSTGHTPAVPHAESRHDAAEWNVEGHGQQTQSGDQWGR